MGHLGLATSLGVGITVATICAAAEPTNGDKSLDTPAITHKSPPAGALINVNIRDADLPDAVQMVSEWTGRRFVFGGKLRKVSLNVISPKPVTVNEAYGAFLSALASHGLTVVPAGRYLKIVETQGAASELTPIYGTAESVPNSERFVTRLYRLRHIDAAMAEQVLSKFKSKDADITVYPGSKLLIITDTGSHIVRLLRLIEELDHQEVGENIYLQPLLHTNATEVATLLNDMMRIDDGSRILPDERNNQLVIVMAEDDYRQVLALLRRIDLPARKGGQFRAIRLQHARCDEIEPALTKVTSVPTDAPAPAGAPAGARAGLFEGQVAVHCVEASNALMVVSSLRDYAQLQHIVAELDEPRRQVFIEAVIMDVKVKDFERFGIAGHGAGPLGIFGAGAIGYGGLNAASSIGPPSNLEALAFGVRGPGVEGSSALSSVPGVSIPAFGIALNALATDGDANLLATPHVLATDNIASEISIGENIALTNNIAPAAVQFPGVPGVPPTAQAERKDVGIILNITPHINDADQVRLEIDQEYSSASPNLVGTLGTVNVAKRTAKTTVVVNDQQTVVIGGLTREEHINETSKIPVLGDIPIIGALFSDTSKTTQKVNLLLVLTPHIIRNEGDLRRIFERKMQERQEFLDRYFVFDETIPWEPLVDYTRTNGMLEHIRQTQLRIATREEMHRELDDQPTLTHTAVEPIGMPSIAGKKDATPAPSGRANPKPTSSRPRPTSRKKTRKKARKKTRVPGSAPNRYRVE